MEKHELTFNDIFKEDGLYRNDNFTDGIALEVKDGNLKLIYWSKLFIDEIKDWVLTDKMVNKYKYYKVHNKSQLFSNGTT